MSVRFYMDVHVRKVISRELRKRGVDVLTAQEDGTTRLLDPALLDRATELGRVLVTEDKHFPVEVERRQRLGIPFKGVLFIRLHEDVGKCLEEAELFAVAGSPGDFENQIRRIPIR